jgi:hypothetical protein
MKIFLWNLKTVSGLLVEVICTETHINQIIPHVLSGLAQSLFFFSRVAAAVVFDVSRIQTFQSVSKVSNKTVCKICFYVELSIASFISYFPLEIP